MKTNMLLAGCVALLLSCKGNNGQQDNSSSDIEIQPTSDTITDTIVTKETDDVDTGDTILDEADLNIVRGYKLAGKDYVGYGDEGKPLEGYLKPELIDKDFYNSKKNTVVNYFTADTTAIRKVNGVLQLKCNDSIKKFTDKLDAEEENQEYTYLGRIDALNCYIVSGSYYEGWDYELINRNNCSVTSIDGFPYLSPDKKKIVSFSYNPYEDTEIFEYYKVNQNGEITEVMLAEFINWVTLDDTVFWSSDGYIYAMVENFNQYLKDNGEKDNGFQYIRIKIL